MPFDLSPVPIPRGVSQLELLPGQPPRGQVGDEGERASIIVASVQLLGEARRQSLSIFTAGACWMPAATFLAGDRIEAFLDDRILAVALLCYIAFHDSFSFRIPILGVR